MRIRWICSLFLLLTLLLSALPAAQAAVIPIDPAQYPVITSDPAEFQKIVQLKNEQQFIPFSLVSPDDQHMVFVQFGTGKEEVLLLNLSNNTTQPLPQAVLALPPLTVMSWLNSQTLAYLTVVYDPQDNRPPTPALSLVDIKSGQVKASPVNLPGMPLSLSPDGTKAVLVIESSAGSPGNPALRESDSQGNALSTGSFRWPFDQKIKPSMAVASPVPGWLSHLNPLELHRLQAGNGFADEMDFSSQSLGLLVLDLRTNKVEPLLELPPDTSLESLAWSPDSSRLAIGRVTTPNVSHVGQRLTDMATQDGLGNYSLQDNPFIKGSQLDLVDFSAGTAAVRQGVVKGSTFQELVTGAAWNNDNSMLALVTAKPARLAGRANPVAVFPEGLSWRFINPDGQVTGTINRPELNDLTSGATFVSSDELLVSTASGTNLTMYIYNRSNGNLQRMGIPDGTVLSALPTHQSRQVIFTFSSFVQAPEIYRVNMDGSAFYRYTFANEDLSRFGRVQVNPVSFTLSGGQVRSGYILQKAGAAFPPDKAKMIVWQEGGPTGPFLNRWSTSVESPFNLLPNFGFSILFVPLPGRTGFGPAFLNALADNRNFGQIDIDEQAEIVQQMFGRGYTAPGSIGITGCSYGGYFTSQSITRHPDLYAAANTQCTLLDLFNEWQFGYTAYMSYLIGRTPLDDPAEYAKDSPMFNVNKTTTPLLMFHGQQDFLPVTIAENFHDKLKLNGAAVNLMRFKQEGHGLAIPTNQLMAAQAQIDWFRQFLK
ncbi:MAG TPA: prolyl oligopeptidase family serine peptidase [Chloroflexia bacterium]|nr:prolyl oligopeptidase family serine peptidase [Chloroflexia bacterium]